VLIAGGADKRLPASAYAQVRQLINRTCKAAVLFKGAGTKKIGRLNIPTVQGVKTMADALGIARRLSKIGDVVLLSPGCASFGLFMNEFDRGGQFRRLVKKL